MALIARRGAGVNASAGLRSESDACLERVKGVISSGGGGFLGGRRRSAEVVADRGRLREIGGSGARVGHVRRPSGRAELQAAVAKRLLHLRRDRGEITAK